MEGEVGNRTGKGAWDSGHVESRMRVQVSEEGN